MIEIYAILLLNFVRQSTSPPDINWQTIILALIGAGGIAVTIVGVIGGIVLDKIKTANTEHLKEVDKRNTEATLKSETEAARAKANADEDSAIASALVPLINQNKLTLDLFGRVTQLSAEANSLLKSHAEMMKNFNEEQIKARALWHSSMETKMSDLEESIVNRAIGDTETLAGIRTDIAAVKSDLDEKADKILKSLDDKPNVQGHQEATKQITGLLTEIKSRLASIEARLPVVEPPRPTGVGTADAPTGEPKESEKPQ